MSGPASNDPTSGAFISPVFYDRCVITSGNATTSRVMLGGADGFVTEQETLPQLTATVYLQGVALNPQPDVLWEVNSDACSIDQSGNITRRQNPNAAGFDSNGCATIEHTGQLVQVTVTVLRQDGSKSGILGTLPVIIQNHAPRQWASGHPDNIPSVAAGSFNLVQDTQPAVSTQENG